MEVFPKFEYVALQMLPFLFAMFVLNKLVFQPLLAYLKERHHRMVGFSHDAKSMTDEIEKQRAHIDRTLADNRAAVSEARARVIAVATEEEKKILAAARERAEKRMDAFREELAGAQQQAAKQLRAEAQVLSSEIASHLLGRTVA